MYHFVSNLQTCVTISNLEGGIFQAYLCIVGLTSAHSSIVLIASFTCVVSGKISNFAAYRKLFHCSLAVFNLNSNANTLVSGFSCCNVYNSCNSRCSATVYQQNYHQLATLLSLHVAGR